MRETLFAIFSVAILSMTACERPAEKSANDADPTPTFFEDTIPGPQTNALADLPGFVYSSQASSPIHWQPWTDKTLKMAKDSNRLLVVAIALPQQTSFLEILKELESDAEAVLAINENYVPVLVDGDAVREMGLLTIDLCAEIGTSLQLPLMLWITPDADPVAWIPLSSPQSGSVADLFTQSNVMIERVWSEDKEYVSKNSQTDQNNRRKRMSKRLEKREVNHHEIGATSPKIADDAARALRQLTSLYDSVSRTFDEAGGLFPSGALDILALGARCDELPPNLQEKSATVLRYLLDDLLPSPMFDPLDGGVYSSRRGSTWALPGFQRNSVTQARVAISLLNAFSATGDERARDRALEIIRFMETEYATPDGLFVMGERHVGKTEDWLWRIEDLEEILSADELAMWVPATGMKDQGNLPSELDPQREYFRANSISFVKTAAELAAISGKDRGETQELLNSAKRKLLKARDERLSPIPLSNPRQGHALATFRAASAYATAYQVTGDINFLEKAKKTLSKARENFSNGPELTMYARTADTAPSLIAGRAFLYAMALDATIDLWAVTLDEEWLFWADDLATTTAEHFVADGYLRECPQDANLMKLPISDVAMLFEESSAGMISMAAARLRALGRPLLPALETEALKFPIAAIHSPILHTDFIHAFLIRGFGTTYGFGPELPENLKNDLTRAPLKEIFRRAAGRDFVLPAELKPEELLKITPDGKSTPVSEVNRTTVPDLRNP